MKRALSNGEYLQGVGQYSFPKPVDTSTPAVSFGYAGSFNSGIIDPPPPFTIYFEATLKNGIRYEYGYAVETEDQTRLEQDTVNRASYITANGPVPTGGRYFNQSKLGGAYYKIPV
jgi:hypothetical protein